MKYQCVYINEREQKLNGGLFEITDEGGEYTFKQVSKGASARKFFPFTTRDVTVHNDGSIGTVHEQVPLTFWGI
jgi:hypothetical protein